MAGHVITVAQQKGGSGKTTLAAHLALGFRAQGKTVALVDLDPQGSLGRWFMTRVESDPALCEGLDFSTSSAWGISYECRKLADANDIVIIDTPPKADSDLRPALRVAHLVVVPVATSHVDLWATEGVLDLANREGKPALVVMNRTRPNTRLGQEVFEAAGKLDAEVAEASLANRVGYAEAMGKGRGITEGPKGPGRDEVTALTAEVAARF
ncbi:ParA family partition ATPase [Tropicibacter naphthalenivorans]|uniref:ParA-like protein n=1 Tax=Tropicibacter naphthalenivorans TaxID=441103 RepID=A0A0P1G122_9RHOB|nr:ParA family partition ATPase [Tropicibacter naphthalenivorans]CUH75372.1 ParA-like protein [Tropicibacter naphthalenivorans]SMC44780.1 chromosome partitioning protein [Tropicibacter naphthalenivorans]